MTTALITIFIIQFILLLASGFLASYLYGTDKIKTKMLIEAKRREKRLVIQLNLIHNVLVKKAGLGDLRAIPKPEKETEKQPSKRVVAPSEVISELKAEASKQPKIIASQVPKEIETPFLESVKPFAR